MSKQTTILLIDDDEDDRWLFEEALRRTAPHVKCITATDGVEAISFLQQTGDVLPDLIFLDLNMPGMDGKKCLSLLKQNKKLSSIKVIIYTTSDYYKDRDDAMKLGASEFIMKPADYKQLCVMLQERFC